MLLYGVKVCILFNSNTYPAYVVPLEYIITLLALDLHTAFVSGSLAHPLARVMLSLLPPLLTHPPWCPLLEPIILSHLPRPRPSCKHNLSRTFSLCVLSTAFLMSGRVHPTTRRWGGSASYMELVSLARTSPSHRLSSLCLDLNLRD